MVWVDLSQIGERLFLGGCLERTIHLSLGLESNGKEN